jgi:hypothetical protein
MRYMVQMSVGLPGLGPATLHIYLRARASVSQVLRHELLHPPCHAPSRHF